MKNFIVSEVEIIYKNKVDFKERKKIATSKDVYQIFKTVYNQDKVEYREMFYAMYLNRSYTVLGVLLVSEGGVSGTVVDPKIVFQGALKLNASAIILSHNHPSGNLQFSKADIHITKKIKQGGKLLDIQILDHFLITSEGYLSYSAEGLF